MPNSTRNESRLVVKRRRFSYKQTTWALVLSLAVHLGVYFWLASLPVEDRPAPPPDHIQFEYITLPKPVNDKPNPQVEPPQEKNRTAITTRRILPAPQPKPPQKPVAEPEADPPLHALRLKRPRPLPDYLRPWAQPLPDYPRPWAQPPPPRPAVKRANRDSTFVEYYDGGVTLRNPELARRSGPARAATVDNSVQVDQNGRVLDGHDSPEATKKRLLAQLPRLGARSPKGLDLGKFDWYAKTLAKTCGIYAPGQDGGIPNGVYVVIDSSGSMTRNRYTSPATTCGYSVAFSAIDASEETNVGVINFSTMDHVVEKTRDLGLIADGITRAAGGETFMPGSQIKNYVDGDGRMDIIVITDSHIRNYRTALPHFKDVLKRNSLNRGVLIVIGDERLADQAAIRQFIWAGFTVQHHTRFHVDEVPDMPQPRSYRFGMSPCLPFSGPTF